PPSSTLFPYTTLFRSILVDLWQKFGFITTLAAACGLARSPVGPLRGDPLGRRLLERAIREVVAVARSRGIPLPEDEVTRVMGVRSEEHTSELQSRFDL